MGLTLEEIFDVSADFSSKEQTHHTYSLKRTNADDFMIFLFVKLLPKRDVVLQRSVEDPWLLWGVGYLASYLRVTLRWWELTKSSH